MIRNLEESERHIRELAMSREAIKELCDLIDAAGGSLTFSKDCVSGIVGRDTCRCWRCRDVDPGDQEPGWERAAELITEGFHAEQRMRIRMSRVDEEADPRS